MSRNLREIPMVVLKGGPGTEREVSLRSGAAVARVLASGGYRVTEVDVPGDRVAVPAGTGLCFNMIHGTFGEDGALQAQLDALGVPYTGEGAEGSRVAFDKLESKARFAAAGIPTARWEILRPPARPSFPLPMVVKAPRQGSSVGVHIVREAADLEAALADCARFDRDLLVEEFFEGRELTVGILGSGALAVVEIRPVDGFYDYQHKYTKGASEYFCPAPLDAAVTASVQQAALAAHRALGLEVYSRVDVLLASDGRLCVLEANTIPGMTETSLLPKAAAAVGLSFLGLCEEIARLSLQRCGVEIS